MLLGSDIMFNLFMGLLQFNNEICSINKSFLNVSCFCLEYDDFRYFTINQGIIQRPVFNYYFFMEKVTNTLFNSFQTDHQAALMHFLVVLTGSFCYHIDRNVARFPAFEALSIYISSETKTIA